MIINSILFLIIIISVYTDLKSRRILNIVTLPAIIIGILLNTITGGIDGLLFSGKGFLLGLGIFIIPFLRGGMGAGDVKLMAAIGALKGASFVFHAFIYTAIIGGVISLILLIRKMGVKQMIFHMFFTFGIMKGNAGTITHPKNKDMTFPYGIAIALGTLCAYIWGGFL